VRNFIRDLSAGWAIRAYAVAVVGAVAVFVGEQIFPDAATKCALADFAWTAAALAAIFGTARAALRTRDGDRLIWLFFCAGAVSWLAGQLARDLGDVGGLVFSPLWIDAGFMTAAPLWTIGLVVLLRIYSNRLALYALALDVAAVVVTVVAGVAMFLSSTLARDLSRDPAASAVAVAYPVLYVAATAAALSVVWGAAPSRPRGALISLFAGLGLNALAFTLYLPGTVQDTFTAGTPLDTLWILGMAAIAIGAAQWTERPDPASAAVDSTSALELSRMLLPGVVAAATAFLLVYTDTTGIRAAEGLVDAAIASAVLILATRAGLALYGNWRLGERERRRAEQLAALYDVGLATAGELGLGELAYLVAREATALTRTDGAMVALAERGKGFVVRAQHNAPALGLRVSVGESMRGIALEALRTRDLVVAAKYGAHPDANRLLRGLIASAIAAPLIAHGELVGTLTAYSREPRVFTDETQRLVRLYAAQAAIAIANADLLAETRRLARDDDLTGVLNRRSLLERLEAEISSASRHGDAFAVVMCDVDGLKGVNDSAGHLVGNEVLKAAARAMRETTRAEDVVARVGGDEFVLLLPRTAPLPARALIGRIGARLRDEHYTWAGRANPLPRASFGIAWFPEDGRDADALLGAADARMYQDKTRAREMRVTAAAEAD